MSISSIYCIRLLLIVATASCLAGCNLPLSKYPLSTSADSIEIDKLLGKWSVELHAPPKEIDPSAPEQPAKQVATFRPHPRAKNLYAVKNLHHDDAGEEGTLAFCRVGQLVCVTMPMLPETGNLLVDPAEIAKSDDAIAKKLALEPAADETRQLAPFGRFSIWCAEFENDDEMKLFLLDSEKVVAAIQRGDLTGIVHQPPPPADDPNAKPDPSKRTIQIQANSAELRAFIEKHGRSVFATVEHLKFERVK